MQSSSFKVQVAGFYETWGIGANFEFVTARPDFSSIKSQLQLENQNYMIFKFKTSSEMRRFKNRIWAHIRFKHPYFGRFCGIWDLKNQLLFKNQNYLISKLAFKKVRLGVPFWQENTS